MHRQQLSQVEPVAFQLQSNGLLTTLVFDAALNAAWARRAGMISCLHRSARAGGQRLDKCSPESRSKGRARGHGLWGGANHSSAARWRSTAERARTKRQRLKLQAQLAELAPAARGWAADSGVSSEAEGRPAAGALAACCRSAAAPGPGLAGEGKPAPWSK